MNNLIKAVKYEVQNGRIVLFDENGNKVDGKNAYWEGDFVYSGNGLTSLDGAPSTVGGSFYCYDNSLTSLDGAPSTVCGNFCCSSSNLTSLEGATSLVGGSFNCPGNGLTSLDGAPSTIGGYFYCSSSNLTSLEGASLENQEMFNSFLDKGFIFADGILTEFVSKHGDVYKTKRIGCDDVLYVIARDGVYAHGETIKKAREDLAFKMMSKDVSQFENMSLDTVKTPSEWALVYRAITRACEIGTRMFMETQGKMKDRYTLKEILKLTDGQYGSSRFIEVVKG